jgi:hypothetical protein
MNKKKRMSNKSLNLVFIIVFLGIFLFLQSMGGIFFPLPYRSLAPFSGKVIDAETKEPIAEAVVLAVYYMTSYTVAGSNSYVEDGQETLTDKNGEFRIPRERRWFVLHRGYPKGSIVIFKPGYGAFPQHRQSEAVGENKSWPPPNKYIVYEIPKLKTKNERNVNLPGRYPFSKIPYERQKMYINAINEERRNLGLSPLSVPKKER